MRTVGGAARRIRIARRGAAMTAADRALVGLELVCGADGADEPALEEGEDRQQHLRTPAPSPPRRHTSSTQAPRRAYALAPDAGPIFALRAAGLRHIATGIRYVAAHVRLIATDANRVARITVALP